MNSHTKKVINSFRVILSLVLLAACNEQQFYEKEFLNGVGVEKEVEKDSHDDTEIREELPEQAAPEVPVVVVTPPTTPVQDNSNNNEDNNSSNDNSNESTSDQDEETTQASSESTSTHDNNNQEVTQVDQGSETEENTDQQEQASENDTGNESENSGPKHVDYTEEFSGKSITEKSKVDILWVIDNSGSMKNEQEDLAYNFDIFIKDFIERGIDFKMGITSTDARDFTRGKMHGDFKKLNSDYANKSKWDFIDYYSSAIQLGVKGHYLEKGFWTSLDFLKRYSKDFLRKDAYLAIVYVSDEPEQSHYDLSKMQQELLKIKGNAEKIKVYSIVNTETYGRRNQHKKAPKYIDLAKWSNGSFSDIRKDFYPILKGFGKDIVTFVNSFKLKATPIKDSICIKIEGKETNQWSYSEKENAILFNEGFAPKDAEKVKVTYKSGIK